jgi:hypothetical protein
MTIININCCPVATQKPLSSVTPTPTITTTNTPTPTPTITPTRTGMCISAESITCLPIETSLVYSDGATLKRIGQQFVTAGQTISFSVRGCVSCIAGSCLSDARGLYGTPNAFIGNYNAVFGVISATNSPSIPFTTTNAFYIGLGGNIVAPSSGYVYCGIWDSGTWFDNVGNYCVYMEIS